jgi:hypothetical protein
MLGTLFQFCCVLISMDTLDSLADLRYAMKTVNLIRDRYPGEKKAQALSTLRALITASKQRKQTQIAYLSAVEEPEESCVNMHDDFSFPPTDLAFPELPFDITRWGMEDLDWMPVEAPLGL